MKIRMLKRIKEKGITLVVLVITIIVLLLLAGVSITTVYNGEGIFHIASETANKSKIAQIQEELELLKTLVMPGTLDDYMKRLQDESEKYRADEFEQLDEEHWTVVIEERYEFLIYTDADIGTARRVSSRSGTRGSTSGNIIIEFQGEINTGLLVLSEKKGTLQYPTPIEFTVVKNTSGGKLSVVSSDNSIASASIEGNKVTVVPKFTSQNGKRVIITVMSEPRGNYLRQKAKYTATVNKGGITIDATPYEGEYDGQKHPALTSVTVNPEDAKLTYSIGDGGYTEEIPEVEMTGEYTISIRAEREGFDTREITKTVTVNRQKDTQGNIELSETSGTIVYPTEKIVTIMNNSSNGELSVSSSDESIAKASINGNTITITPQILEEDEKQVTITVRASETENYKEQTATYEATVYKGSITLEATAYKGIYDGNSHQAVTLDTVEPEDSKVTYSVNGGAYQEEIPQIDNAEVYSISIQAEKKGYNTKEITKTVTISKQGNMNGTVNANLVLSESSGTITYPTAKTITVASNKSNGSLSVISSDSNILTATISDKTITMTPQVITTDGQKVTITVKAEATGNYEEQTATFEATVNRGIISISGGTAYSGTYDASGHSAVSTPTISPSGCTVTYSLNGGSYSSSIPTITNAGSYTVKIKATKSGYKDNEITKSPSIAKASQNITVSSSSLTLKSGATTNINVYSYKGTLAVTSTSGTSYSATAYSSYITVTAKTVTANTSSSFYIYSRASDNYLESNRILITVTAQPDLPAKGTPPPSGGWPVETAKGLVERDGLKDHLGEKVDYNPKNGGTWRIFYYDDSNPIFGRANTVYLKRDYNADAMAAAADKMPNPPNANGVVMMKRFNPMWRDSSLCQEYMSPNERSVAWLCTPSIWADYCDSEFSTFAIASPSIEMYVKAYNIYNDNNTALIYSLGNDKGYTVGAYNSYTWNGSDNSHSGEGSLVSGPNNLFMTPGQYWWWLASPSYYSEFSIVAVGGNKKNIYADGYGNVDGICPLVPLDK